MANLINTANFIESEAKLRIRYRVYFVVASFEAFRWGVFPTLALLLPGGLDDVELRKKKRSASECIGFRSNW